MKINITVIGCLIFCQCCFAQHWQSLGLGLWPSTTTFMYSDTIDDMLYVGGQFVKVDGNNVRGIASWDGTDWAPMGDGIDSCPTCGSMPTVTWAITRYGNHIYAGGGFRWIGEVGARYLARWDGSNWDTIPGGQPNDVVLDVIVYNNELYACGVFDSVGNVSANRVAKWDGTTWSPIGGNYDFGTTGTVSKMAFYHGELYVGGIFQDPQGVTCRLARWDGTSWDFMTSDLVGGIADVWDFAIYNDELYVSGLFYAGVGNNPANCIMRWNDTTWRDVGGSVEFYSHNVPQVRQMLVHDGKLFCSGNFEKVGGVFAFGLASWDGTNWCGYNTSFTTNTQECGTWNIEFFHDTLHIGGGFFMADGDSLAGIGKWIDGSFVDSCGNTTGISDEINSLNYVMVYPSPSAMITSFQFSGYPRNRTLIIFDQLGREIWNTESNENTIEFPAYQFADGMYYYSVLADDQKLQGKFLIQR